MTRPLNILLVEDNPGDVKLLEKAFQKSSLPHTLTVAHDGIEALQLLRDETLNADIVLLDLSLPRKSGREVLAEIKEDPSLRRIPVVVLSASAAPEDVNGSYDLHANCYLCKPVGLDEYLNMIRQIEDFWLNTVELPRHGHKT